MSGAGAGDEEKVRSILFACNMNSVRSPMAEALARRHLSARMEVASCGVHEGIIDPFAAEVLEEVGVPRPDRQPRDFGRVRLQDYDVIVALTPEAAAEARRLGAKPEFWETENPTSVRGDREEVLEAYRAVRDELAARIKARFA
jgi:protein-tyrosine-phosphatase